ncbi:hypothetical protein IPV08_04795 [Methylobacterium sp. SD274]|jgi:hypothetical protein|nr:hypothetical protein [Methylobacterium sp. SD274]MBO1019284.1 hypothetical protein [Methylobacterium sp. SD274]
MAVAAAGTLADPGQAAQPSNNRIIDRAHDALRGRDRARPHSKKETS